MNTCVKHIRASLLLIDASWLLVEAAKHQREIANNHKTISMFSDDPWEILMRKDIYQQTLSLQTEVLFLCKQAHWLREQSKAILKEERLPTLPAADLPFSSSLPMPQVEHFLEKLAEQIMQNEVIT